MRQILYISTSAVPGDRGDLVGILAQSRHNNAIDGITGILWSDGRYFLQILEGPAESVAAAMTRIHADARHRAIEVLVDQPIEAREFGGWSMIHRRADDAADAYDVRVRHILSNASDRIRAPFLELIASDR